MPRMRITGPNDSLRAGRFLKWQSDSDPQLPADTLDSTPESRRPKSNQGTRIGAPRQFVRRLQAASGICRKTCVGSAINFRCAALMQEVAQWVSRRKDHGGHENCVLQSQIRKGTSLRSNAEPSLPWPLRPATCSRLPARWHKARYCASFLKANWPSWIRNRPRCTSAPTTAT